MKELLGGGAIHLGFGRHRLVRRPPQAYKCFIRSCALLTAAGGGGGVGTVRKLHVLSGLPASSSRELLEVLDDEMLVFDFRVVGGDHRLRNYRSVTTLHPAIGGASTVVVKPYDVDVSEGNTREKTTAFADTT